jgi:segregation and condensation protein B
MKQILHVAVVSTVVGVAALGYWSSVQAESDSSGGVGEDFEVTGIIDAIDDTSVTIGGVVYSLTDATETEGLLAVGEEVDIEFVDNGDGTFTALEIENESEDVEDADDADETEDAEDEDDEDDDEQDDDSDDLDDDEDDDAGDDD